MAGIASVWMLAVAGSNPQKVNPREGAGRITDAAAGRSGGGSATRRAIDRNRQRSKPLAGLAPARGCSSLPRSPIQVIAPYRPPTGGSLRRMSAAWMSSGREVIRVRSNPDRQAGEDRRRVVSDPRHSGERCLSRADVLHRITSAMPPVVAAALIDRRGQENRLLSRSRRAIPRKGRWLLRPHPRGC